MRGKILKEVFLGKTRTLGCGSDGKHIEEVKYHFPLVFAVSALLTIGFLIAYVITTDKALLHVVEIGAGAIFGGLGTNVEKNRN